MTKPGSLEEERHLGAQLKLGITSRCLVIFIHYVLVVLSLSLFPFPPLVDLFVVQCHL